MHTLYFGTRSVFLSILDDETKIFQIRDHQGEKNIFSIISWTLQREGTQTIVHEVLESCLICSRQDFPLTLDKYIDVTTNL